ncbi:MAG: radical SAM protein [Desulfobacterium sp.]|nr:radical SAM protein [Desulfobacterium sp.]
MTTDKEHTVAFPAHTQSLCPYCLKKLSATRVEKKAGVFLVKECPEHGPMETIIWRGEPDMKTWTRGKTPAGPEIHSRAVEKGCPFDCGLCPGHRQRTCTALLEITWRCNLHCPVCFADSGDAVPDPGLDRIRAWYEEIRQCTGGGCNIQLSGGEPTVRDDLPEIIAMGKEMGFGFIQVNTNGLRLAQEGDFAGRLKQAGLDSVFLQFDGVDDQVHLALRGRKLQAIKERAIANCRSHNLGVVLVPTLVPGVNDHQIGDIIRFGLENCPQVRGVHFQPVSYFGRYPKPPGDADRITLPQVIQGLEDQTGIKAAHFRPPG